MTGVPLPLNTTQAIEHAAYLHREGMSWAVIAKVMALYHGHWLSRTGWYHRCRKAAPL